MLTSLIFGFCTVLVFAEKRLPLSHLLRTKQSLFLHSHDIKFIADCEFPLTIKQPHTGHG